jgi:hypothetical protein
LRIQLFQYQAKRKYNLWKKEEEEEERKKKERKKLHSR